MREGSGTRPTSPGIGVCGTTNFMAISTTVVAASATGSRRPSLPRPFAYSQTASAASATVESSTLPGTERALPMASSPGDDRAWEIRRSCPSRSRSSPAPAAAERVANAAIVTSNVPLPPLTWARLTEEMIQQRKGGRPQFGAGLSGASGYGVPEDAAVLARLEDTLGLALELADALAGDVQLLAQFGEGCGLAVVQAVAPDEHVPRPLGKVVDGLLEVGRLHLAHDSVRGVRDLLVLDKVPELACGVLAGDRLVEARSVGHRPHGQADLLELPLQVVGHLLPRPLALERVA